MTEPRSTPDPNTKLVIVFSTDDAARAAVAESLLRAAEIDYFVRGRSGRIASISGVGAAEFQVREADAPDALRLLQALNESDSGGAR